MSKIIEFPQTSELDKQFMTIEAQQKIIRDQAAKIKKLEDEKKSKELFKAMQKTQLAYLEKFDRLTKK